MKIIVVEDNVKIRKELLVLLERYGYESIGIDSFDHVIEDILSYDGQLVLLDINLPVFDGYYICRELRKKSDIPIIIVTSRDSEMDELMSMNLGADDFITKPYNTEILLAHISSLLKRTYNQTKRDQVNVGRVTLDFTKWEVCCQGKTEMLTKNESRILRILMEANGSMVSRENIMDELWQGDDFIDDNTLTVNVNRIRKKLENIGAKGYIETKRGYGYRICEL